MRWLLILLLLMSGRAGLAAPSADEFDKAAERVLKDRRYEWRTAKPPRGKDESSVMGHFLWEAMKAVADGVKAVYEAIEGFFKWVGSWFGGDDDKERPPKSRDLSDFDFTWLQIALWVVLAGLFCYLAVQGWRAWQKVPKAAPALETGLAKVGKEEIAREELSGAEMPEDEWLRLAAELRAQGELRLALRAYFLASLSALGSRQWLRLRAFKSNREYELELKRRAPTRAELIGLFSGQGRDFERHWYGSWPVEESQLERTAREVLKVRELAAP